jgi:hypothetical protein
VSEPYVGLYFEQLIHESMRKQSEAIERACENMLVSVLPQGVLVETWFDGWRVSSTTEPPYKPMTISYQIRSGPMPREES